MNAATERAALLHGVQFYDEMTAAVDDRTLDIVAETGQIKPEWKDRSAAEGGFWTNKYH